MVELVSFLSEADSDKSESERESYEWSKDQPSVLIGRSSSTDFRVTDDLVSSVHCLIVQKEDGSFFLRDLESSNGTFVDGEKIKQTVLDPGDTFRVGDTEINIKGRFPSTKKNSSPHVLDSLLEISPLKMILVSFFIGLIAFALLTLITYLVFVGTGRKQSFLSPFSSTSRTASDRAEKENPTSTTSKDQKTSSTQDTSRSFSHAAALRDLDALAYSVPEYPWLNQKQTNPSRPSTSAQVFTYSPPESYRQFFESLENRSPPRNRNKSSSQSPRDNAPSEDPRPGETDSPSTDESDKQIARKKKKAEQAERKNKKKRRKVIETSPYPEPFWADVVSWKRLNKKVRKRIENNKFKQASTLLSKKSESFQTDRYRVVARQRADLLIQIDNLFDHVIQSINNGADIVKKRAIGDHSAKPFKANRSEYTMRAVNEENVTYSIPWNPLSGQLDNLLHTSKLPLKHRISLGALYLEENRTEKATELFQSIFENQPLSRDRISRIIATRRELPSSAHFAPFQNSFVPQKQKSNLREMLKNGGSYPARLGWNLSDRMYLVYGNGTRSFRFRGYAVKNQHPPVQEVRQFEHLPFFLNLILPGNDLHLHQNYRYSSTFDTGNALVPRRVQVTGTWDGLKKVEDRIYLRLFHRVNFDTDLEYARNTYDSEETIRFTRDGELRSTILFDPVRNRVERLHTQGTIQFGVLSGGNLERQETVDVSQRWSLVDSQGKKKNRSVAERVNLKEKRNELYSKIENSIQNGVRYLKNMHGNSLGRGNESSYDYARFWSSPSSIPSHGGATALVIKTLLECGMNRNEPVITTAMDWLEDRYYSQPPSQMPWLTTYSGALGLMALESSIRPPEERKKASQYLWGMRNDFTFQQREPDSRIRRYMINMTAWILRRMSPQNTWCARTSCRRKTYGKIAREKLPDGREVLLLKRKGKQQGGQLDRSTIVPTEYAILALRAAARSGVYIHPDHWKQILKTWLNKQQQNGSKVTLQLGRYGFKTVRQQANARGWSSSASATAGGIAIVKMALNSLAELDALPPDLEDRTKRSIRDGLGWLQDHYHRLPVRGTPEGPIGTGTMPSGDYWPLYRLQQAFLVNIIQQIGGNNWYFDGATGIMQKQMQHGGWSRNVVDTSFALLFLKRATVPGVPTGATVQGIVETGARNADENSTE